MAWKDLTIAQRSQLMNIFRQNGIESLSEMKSRYDAFNPSPQREEPYSASNAAPVYAEGGPKRRETAYARKYREEQEAKAKRALEHPTLNNAFRNDTTDSGEKYYDIVRSRYEGIMNALQRKGFTYEDASRLAPMMVTQNVLEGGWRMSRPDNNFGGMQVNGKFLTFNSPDEYYDAYLDMLDTKWGSSVAMNNWRNAQNLNDWARILNHEDLNLWSKERYDAYNSEHKGSPVYLYAPEWENNYKSYRRHLAGVEPRVNTYLDMVMDESPVLNWDNKPIKESIWNSGEHNRAMQNMDAFNLSLENIQKMLEGNQHGKGGKIRIKPENRGKFTALKKQTGHSTSWFKEHGTPAQKKMAVFELNSRKWGNRKDEGGEKLIAEYPEGYNGELRQGKSFNAWDRYLANHPMVGHRLRKAKTLLLDAARVHPLTSFATDVYDSYAGPQDESDKITTPLGVVGRGGDIILNTVKQAGEIEPNMKKVFGHSAFGRLVSLPDFIDDSLKFIRDFAEPVTSFENGGIKF